MSGAYNRASLESLACFFECYIKRALFFLGFVLCLLIILTGWVLKLKIEEHCGGPSELKGPAKPFKTKEEIKQDVAPPKPKITEKENRSNIEQETKSRNQSPEVDILKPQITESQHSFDAQISVSDVREKDARYTQDSRKPCNILSQFIKCVKEGFACPSSSSFDGPIHQDEPQKGNSVLQKPISTYSVDSPSQKKSIVTIKDKSTSSSEKYNAKDQVLRS